MKSGLHHITAISSNAQKNYDFYTKILGLRFVKRAVNFDAPYVYHLYFGDYEGVPGTALTFFIYPDTATGMRGVGQATSIGFEVPKSSIGYWVQRFIEKGVKHEKLTKRFGQSVLTFYDSDGLQLELIGVEEKELSDFAKWDDSPVPQENAIRGFYNTTLSVEIIEPTKDTLEVMGYEFIAKDGFYYRYKKAGTDKAQFIDLFEMHGWVAGRIDSGTIHHVAFTVEDDKEEMALREKLIKAGLQPTEQIDRNYFRSVYFREPNGVLFEIATSKPGFTFDEKLEELGENLKIPERYESVREDIESLLPKLVTDSDLMKMKGDLDRESGKDVDDSANPKTGKVYKYKFTKGSGDNTYIVFHGTGGDESSLSALVKDLDPNASILALRGDVDENGMLRFFKRKAMGVFDEDDIRLRVGKLREFLGHLDLEIKVEDAIFLGYSNGANIIAAMLLEGVGFVNKAILLRPTLPFNEKPEDLELSGKQVFIASGTDDPYDVDEQSRELAKIFGEAGAEVEQYFSESAHELDRSDIEATKDFIKSL